MIILFDIDDTLMDHSGAVLAATNALHKRVGSENSAATFHRTWTAAIRRYYDRFLLGEISYDAQRRARIRETVDPALSDTAADQLFEHYLATYEAHWASFPDVRPCLDSLSGYRLGIVSNGQRVQQRKKLGQMGIADMFDSIVISEECGFAKPDARIFHQACSALDEVPPKAVYVGDMYDVDASAARGAGLTGIWLDRTRKAGDSHRAPIIQSLAGLEQIVESVDRRGAG